MKEQLVSLTRETQVSSSRFRSTSNLSLRRHYYVHTTESDDLPRKQINDVINTLIAAAVEMNTCGNFSAAFPFILGNARLTEKAMTEDPMGRGAPASTLYTVGIQVGGER